MSRSYGRSWRRRCTRLLAISLWIGAGGSAASGLAAQQPTSVLAFTGATVVDVEGGRLLRGQTVVIAGTRIQTVGPVREVRIPDGARVVDARGKYLIPGLWDMHVHSHGDQDILYRSFIATGVTGVREMSSAWLDSMLLLRREIAAGTRVGPRLLVTGPFLGDENIEWGLKVATPEAARRLVDSLQAAGADFIKHRLDENRPESRAVFFAIAAEARRLGIPLFGHMPSGVTPGEASDSGQRSIEHTTPWLCQDTIYHYNMANRDIPNPPREQCAAMAARFRHNGTWANVGDELYPFRPLCRDAGPAVYPDPLTNPIRRWTRGVALVFRTGPCAERPRRPAYGWTALPLIVGSDMTTQYLRFVDKDSAALAKAKLYHESPVPHVLARLVAGGMTPLEALRAATLNPAQFLHATDSLGAVAEGKLADLVLLDGNPLQDIWATTRIRAVVANGRYYDRAALDGLLTEVNRIIQHLPASPRSNLFGGQ